jgi:rare lipoprotein A
MRACLIVVLSGVMLAAGIGCASRGTSRGARGGAFAGDGDGLASYYAERFNGRPTASGEIFRSSALTAAHRTLPFGTWVCVTNLNNRKSVTVRINDRGPFVRGRIIDLSPAAARRIDLLESGTAPVKLEVLGTRRLATAD